jgi:hypothetical protein
VARGSPASIVLPSVLANADASGAADGVGWLAAAASWDPFAGPAIEARAEQILRRADFGQQSNGIERAIERAQTLFDRLADFGMRQRPLIGVAGG